MSAVYYDNINGFSQLKMENGKLYGRLNSGEWQEIETGGEQGEPGAPGADGVSAYVYWAWCADPATRAGFSLTDPADYISFITRNTVLVSPQFSDFTTWVKYVGSDGKNGADGVSTYVYYAYASDADGTNFSLSPADGLNFHAILVTHTIIASPSLSDFAGMFYQYKTVDGEEYLPLSGGTMTGNVFWNAETGFGIRHNGTNVDVGWSYSNHTGAGIGFRKVDYAGMNPGGFTLFARDAANSAELDAFADGRLQWVGNYVTALPGGYSGGTIYVGSNRDIKTIAEAIAYINRYSSGSNKKWTLKLDAGEYAIGMTVYGLWLAIEPASGSYSTACRLTGQITTDHFAVLEFINMHFGGTTNGTVNAGIYGKTSLIKCTNCTFYAGTSLQTSIQGDYSSSFLISGCKFYSPTTSFTNSWFQSIRIGGSCFAGIAGTTTFTGGGYSNATALVAYAGSYIHVGSGAITIRNYQNGVSASLSGNAYVGSTITFSNVTTQFSPAKGTVGNGNSYIN